MNIQNNVVVEVAPLSAVAAAFRLDPRSTQAALSSSGVVPHAYAASDGQSLYEVRQVLRAAPRLWPGSRDHQPQPVGQCRQKADEGDGDSAWGFDEEFESDEANADMATDEDYDDQDHDDFEDDDDELDEGEDFEDDDLHEGDDFEDDDLEEDDDLTCGDNPSGNLW
jgi:hypothetical protein